MPKKKKIYSLSHSVGNSKIVSTQTRYSMSVPYRAETRDTATLHYDISTASQDNMQTTRLVTSDSSIYIR